MKEKKNLLAKDVALLLGIPLVTVQRWVHQGKIPCKFKKNEYFFKQGEIEKWAKSHQFLLKDVEKNSFEQEDEVELSLKSGIERGGGFYDLEGEDIYTVLENAVDKISFPEEVKKDLVLDELINREEIASTGIGKGVALPHAKRKGIRKPIATIGLSAEGIDFAALDSKPVYSVMLLLSSPDTDEHLQAMETIFKHVQRDIFRKFLRQSTTKEAIVGLIAEADEQA